VSEKSKSVHRPLHVPGRRLVVTERMVKTAIENTNSQAQAARWIGVSFTTYKKWAKYYNLYDQHKNQEGKGIKKGWASFDIPLEEIFNGTRKNPYSLAKFKRRLIDEGYMQEECYTCGHNERNLATEAICLMIDFLDGETTNTGLENMRLLCPSCYYSNNGFFPKSKVFCK